jgi:hypothetical protein
VRLSWEQPRLMVGPVNPPAEQVGFRLGELPLHAPVEQVPDRRRGLDANVLVGVLDRDLAGLDLGEVGVVGGVAGGEAHELELRGHLEHAVQNHPVLGRPISGPSGRNVVAFLKRVSHEVLHRGYSLKNCVIVEVVCVPGII